jgi:hypothetical protein
MGVYQDWKNRVESIETEEQHDKFWKEYLDWEKSIYEEILGNPNQVISGKLSELCERFSCESTTFAGFLDGVNTSQKKEYDLDKLKDATEVSLDVDFERLYFNMLDAKADWLYNLPQWDGILTSEKRAEITREFKLSQQAKSDRIERNSPCPCGSGKKYKKCCGK